jgi:hypothetical protein
VKALREAVREAVVMDPRMCVRLKLDDARALLRMVECGEEWSDPATSYGYDLEGFENAWRAAKEGR